MVNDPEPRWLLCDFHIHTDKSDGKMGLDEIIDLYGNNNFDVISITDHVYDRHTVKLWEDNGERPCTIKKEQFEEYMHDIWTAAKKAWKEYRMLVIPGVEITNNHDLFHLLALDIKEYIDPNDSVLNIIDEIHAQSGIAVACHPHRKDSEEEMPFMHLWDNHEKYAAAFDAWEVANRDDLFNVVGLKKFNYLAGSDFHEERHVYSWKSLIRSEKNTEAVKEAISLNENVSLYLLRNRKASETIS
ncbi:MAG: phosphotransferase [Candidatus Omnitrophica bacterium]|nr:phosphotransferase [Candidatus Omnitrophota bacterium]